MFDKDANSQLDAFKPRCEHGKTQERKCLKKKDFIPLVDPEFSCQKGKVCSSKSSSNATKCIKELSIKEGLPSKEEAFRLLRLGIEDAKEQGFSTVRLIHGWGSTGTGGRIKDALPEQLDWLVNAGKIQGYIAGENFDHSNEMANQLIKQHPALKTDQKNLGVTIIVL